MLKRKKYFTRFLVLTGTAPTKEELDDFSPQTTKIADKSTKPVTEIITRGIAILYSEVKDFNEFIFLKSNHMSFFRINSYFNDGYHNKKANN